MVPGPAARAAGPVRLEQEERDMLWNTFRRGVVTGPIALALLALVGPGLARAQEPKPRLASPYQRSGLVTRYTPVLPRLPEDKDRDSFEGTRYNSEKDDSPLLIRPYNSWCNGGMYGHTLTRANTAAVWPFFYGSSGSTIGPDTQGHSPAVGRWITNAFHPYKPVGMYYDRGVYTPIYDFDYCVPGPGPFPWPHFFKRPTGG